MEIRRKFIAEGSKPLSQEELKKEIAERSDGVYASEYQEDNLRHSGVLIAAFRGNERDSKAAFSNAGCGERSESHRSR